MRLNDIQRRFKDTMLDHPKVLDDPPEDFATLFDTGDIPLPVRLKVYRNNIVGSLTDVMIASHPILEKLVGHQFLEMMVRHFVLENPPTQGCLSMYGADFDVFIKNYKPAKAMPYLPDMARLEIAMNETYYAPDDMALSAANLTNVPTEDLHLKLRQNVRLISSEFPLDKIRDFCIEDDPKKTMNFNEGCAKLMIYRLEFDAVIVKLDDDEHDMLAALHRNFALDTALEKTLARHKSFNFQLFMQKHIRLGTFLSLHTNNKKNT